MSVQVQEPQQRSHQPGPSADTNGRPVAAPPPEADKTETSPLAEPSVSVAAPRTRPRIFSRTVLLPVLAVVVIAAAWFGFNTYREGLLYVSTENALLTGQPVQVGSMNAG